MYYRKMIIGFLADSNISPAEQDAIRVLLGKHAHSDDRIMASCLTSIFLDPAHLQQFLEAWEASPGRFLAMIDS